MSKKTNGIQVGNFIVTRDNGSEHDWISIKAVSGFWSMRFRDDNGMFSRIRELTNNKELREYLETWIKVCFLISNATPDVKFMEEFFKSYSDLTERLRGLQQPVSPEDDAKILEEERNMNSIKEGINLSNKIAPEHLEVLVDNPLEQLPNIKNAGSIFLGEYTPEPLGDYMSGTNHVLPTGGTAKFYSALGVYDFIKHSAFSYYSQAVLGTFKDDIMKFAHLEGLDAHANSIKVRFED